MSPEEGERAELYICEGRKYGHGSKTVQTQIQFFSKVNNYNLNTPIPLQNIKLKTSVVFITVDNLSSGCPNTLLILSTFINKGHGFS